MRRRSLRLTSGLISRVVGAIGPALLVRLRLLLSLVVAGVSTFGERSLSRHMRGLPGIAVCAIVLTNTIVARVVSTILPVVVLAIPLISSPVVSWVVRLAVLGATSVGVWLAISVVSIIRCRDGTGGGVLRGRRPLLGVVIPPWRLIGRVRIVGHVSGVDSWASG